MAKLVKLIIWYKYNVLKKIIKIFYTKINLERMKKNCTFAHENFMLKKC